MKCLLPLNPEERLSNSESSSTVTETTFTRHRAKAACENKAVPSPSLYRETFLNYLFVSFTNVCLRKQLPVWRCVSNQACFHLHIWILQPELKHLLYSG